MFVEHEAKVLGIDPAVIRQKIVAAGGVCTVERRLMRRRVYNLAAAQGQKWVRLRDDGGHVTLAVKHIKHPGIDGTHETEVPVGSFEAAHHVMTALGHSSHAHQENYRTSFTLNGAHLEVDAWPLIPPYLEIEGDSTQHVLDTAATLGFTADDLTADNTQTIYRCHGLNIDNYPHLTVNQAK